MAIRRVQVNQHGLKLNGTHLHLVYASSSSSSVGATTLGGFWPLVYADNVNILGGSIHTMKKNTCLSSY
jgi:hypothetical protein